MNLALPPTIPELIDLEHRLESDREMTRAELVRRDAMIGNKIDATTLEGIALYRAWLNEARDSAKPSPGGQIDRLRQWVTSQLVLGGFVLGLAAVGGWLSMASGRPINVIHLWAVMVGLQLLLLLGWVMVIMPERWLSRLPGFAPLQSLLRGVARLIPTVAGWIAFRLGIQGGNRLRDIHAQLRRLDWQYAPIRFWLLLRLTQVFAVSFNVGAALGFVIMATLSDPALGWRSSLLGSGEVHAAARTIALPWSWFAPLAVPTPDEIEATQYSSLEQRFFTGVWAPGGRMWAAWLPFMLASLICYGFAPRLAALIFAHWRLRRALGSIEFAHADFQRLRERLLRPQLETQSDEAEESGWERRSPDRQTWERRSPDRQTWERRSPDRQTWERRSPDWQLFAEQTPLVLKWAGISESDAQIAGLVRRRLGVDPRRVMTVGAIDTSADEAALAEAAADNAPVVLLVEAWEPPVGDYLDFLAALRERAARRPIIVLLYQVDAEGRPAAPNRSDADQWRRRLSLAADPGLRVDALVEESAS